MEGGRRLSVQGPIPHSRTFIYVSKKVRAMVVFRVSVTVSGSDRPVVLLLSF